MAVLFRTEARSTYRSGMFWQYLLDGFACLSITHYELSTANCFNRKATANYRTINFHLPTDWLFFNAKYAKRRRERKVLWWEGQDLGLWDCFLPVCPLSTGNCQLPSANWLVVLFNAKRRRERKVFLTGLTRLSDCFCLYTTKQSRWFLPQKYEIGLCSTSKRFRPQRNLTNRWRLMFQGKTAKTRGTQSCVFCRIMMRTKFFQHRAQPASASVIVVENHLPQNRLSDWWWRCCIWWWRCVGDKN